MINLFISHTLHVSTSISPCFINYTDTSIEQLSIVVEIVVIIIIIKIYFENVNFFQAKLGLDICPLKSLHTSLNTTHSECKPSTFISSIRPPTSHPCYLHISTGRHPIIHTHAQDAQITSIWRIVSPSSNHYTTIASHCLKISQYRTVIFKQKYYAAHKTCFS